MHATGFFFAWAAGLAFTVFTPVFSSARDWPNWRGPDHDGISKESGWDPAKVGNIVWRTKVGTGFSSVAVAAGRLYTLGHDGIKKGGAETVYCLDVATGKPVWTDRYEAQLLPNLHEGGPAATPAVDGGQVFTLSKDGRLIAFRATDGKRLWERNLLVESEMEKPAEWGFAGSPLVLGDKLVVEAAHTIAFDKKSGNVVWKSERFKPAYASPAPFRHGDKNLLATLKSDGLAVLDAETGKTVAFAEWQTRFSTNATTPVVKGDRIYVSTGYKRGCALFTFSGTSLQKHYENKEMSNHMANSLLLDGALYGIDGNTHGVGEKRLVSTDFATGDILWKQGGFGCGSLTAADGKLIVLGEKGELVIGEASKKGFEALARAQVTGGRCWTVPVLSGGRIFVRNAAGDLVCVDVRS